MVNDQRNGLGRALGLPFRWVQESNRSQDDYRWTFRERLSIVATDLAHEIRTLPAKFVTEVVG